MNNNFNKKINKPLFRFFIFFIGLSIVLQFIVWRIHQHGFLAEIIQETLTMWVEQAYLIFSADITTQGNHLIHPDTKRYLVVDAQCTALSLIATLVAAILATPHKATTKIVMIILATILIQLENVVRIVHLFNEIRLPVNNFYLYHLYVWQFINFAYALVVFYLLHTLFSPKKE
ncbi:MAG: hypothetical protein JKY81_11425 [Colwellia sp.]|nr:hypothetical protein [Colwellia sp.]